MFGSQTHERRKARAEAREAIKRAENVALHGTNGDFNAALEDLETKAMLAALPRFLTDLYRDSRHAYLYYVQQEKEAEKASRDNKSGNETIEAGMSLTGSTSAEAVRLFVNATWHPWAGAPRRWYQARKLGLMLEGSPPIRTKVSSEEHSNVRTIEREWIQLAKRVRRERRPSWLSLWK
jgi:hypothetical protein